MTIVVLESPCKPSPSAVEAFKVLMSTCEAYELYQESLDKLPTDAWGGTREHDIRLRNTYYARAAMLDCFERGEAPYASHLLYTQVLDDDDVEQERHRGMKAGLVITEWLVENCGGSHRFYVELGISGGMLAAAESQRSFSQTKEEYVAARSRKLGEAVRAWYLERVPASIAWLK